MAKRQMRNEERLRWLIQFGSDWVEYQTVLVGTWADTLSFERARLDGDLEFNDFGAPFAVRLSEEALRKLRRER
jgi:hypothetical protein